MRGVAQTSISTISVLMQTDGNPKAQQNAGHGDLASSQPLHREGRIAGAGEASGAAAEEITVVPSFVVKRKLPPKSIVIPHCPKTRWGQLEGLHSCCVGG